MSMECSFNIQALFLQPENQGTDDPENTSLQEAFLPSQFSTLCL